MQMCFINFNHSKQTTYQELNSYKSLKINDLEIRFHRNIDEVNTPQYECCPDIFLSYDFLKVLELTPPTGFNFCYLSFFKNGRFVGFSACEIKHFDAAQSLNFEDTSPSLWLSFRKWLAKKVSFQTLIVGNLLLTGEHSYFFKNEVLTDIDKSTFLKESILFAKKILAEENIFIKSVFIKDFFESKKLGNNSLETMFGEGYNEFQVEPNFIFDIAPEWRSFDDYMEALSSKYRVRAKRAFKKIQGIDKKEFNVERIIAHKYRINELYKNICSKSSFNLVDLHHNYFIEMKRQLDEKFEMWGFYTEGSNGESPFLVGFFTIVDNGEELEAHYLGYDENYNAEHQLYLNFLFEIIKLGIEKGKKRIIFARTAHEIKSSVGAQAYDMFLYMKHDNHIINRLLPYFLRILSPREKWLPRQPFKTEVQNLTNS